MKQSEIKAYNVIEYIKEQQLLSKTKIVWTNINAINEFRKMAQCVFNPNDYGTGAKFPDDFPNGYTFMGIKHSVGIIKKLK